MLNSRAVGIAFALAVLTTTVAGHGNHAKRQTTRQALNTQPYNSLPNPGGPILYYNGTGDVPSCVNSPAYHAHKFRPTPFRNISLITEQISRNIARSSSVYSIHRVYCINPNYCLQELILISTSTLENYFFSEIVAITSNSSIFNTSCSKCIATTEVLHLAAITQPVTTLTNLFIRYCKWLRVT